MAVEQKCPTCKRAMKFVKDWPFEERPAPAGKFAAALASTQYECPEHGGFRIYISGRVEKID